MARARNIKPSLFKNEILGVADPLLTILFEGLWCLADREGRLEDRPLRIKAEIFPYRENLDINRYLTELHTLGFIVRYAIDGLSLIYIINFNKHQNPHKTERDSELPGYSDSCEISVKDTLNNGTRPADSLLPLTDSLNPIKDTYVETEISTIKVPIQKIIELYHQLLPQLPRCMKLTKKRVGYIQQRWREDMPDLKNWENFFSHVGKSEFLTGKARPINGHPIFRADIEWLCNPTNFTKIAEGKYHVRRS